LPAQAALATDMKTYWANFVKTGDPNLASLNILVDLRSFHSQPPLWPLFNVFGDPLIQSLTPPAVLAPRGPHPFNTCTSEHFCATWQPLLAFNNGNEPHQP
jgi:hypothetical protein